MRGEGRRERKGLEGKRKEGESGEDKKQCMSLFMFVMSHPSPVKVCDAILCNAIAACHIT